MSSLFLPKGKPYNKYALLQCQGRLLERHFPFLSWNIQKQVLTAAGWLQPADCKDCYHIRIEYVAGQEPKSTILFPKVTPSRDIHMYRDHSLCLHYPPDMYWNEKIDVYQYTVPWISEWITYYELYLMNGGIWEGPVSPVHFTEANINTNKDND